MQLQPAVVVTASAYLELYPKDRITTRYVVVNGCRRLAAAHKYGCAELDIVVNDAIARDRITLISAAITENVDRQDFDVIEEARAVEALVAECGRADLAGQRLHRTESWVSQRRALLKLAPELQTALRRGNSPSAKPAPWPGCPLNSKSPAGAQPWIDSSPGTTRPHPRIPNRPRGRVSWRPPWLSSTPNPTCSPTRCAATSATTASADC